MYDQIAHLYDLFHADFSKDKEFLIGHRNILREPILELGCGTGRLLLALAEEGFNITGIDSSQAMLARAREKLVTKTQLIRERITLLEGDIAAFNVDDQFGTIVCSHNTLYHLNKADRKACFQLIQKHLLPGGVLFIDLDNPIEVADPIDNGLLLLEKKIKDQNRGNVIVQSTSSWVDADGEQCQLTWIFDESPQAGGLVKRIVVETVFHLVDRHTLQLELDSAGLNLQAVYGDYDDSPYDERSSRLLVLAGKL